MKLKDLLKENNITGDTPILVKKGGIDMAVSPRYLQGGWDEILNAEVINSDIDSRMFIVANV